MAPPLADRQLVQPEPRVPRRPTGPVYPGPASRRAPGFLGLGPRVSWVAGLVLAVSAFTDWYAGHSLEGPPIAVIGWHTGTLGKLVFFAGLAVVLLALARQIGVELPPSLPESLVVAVLGALATVFVLIRVISIPDTFADTASRGVGIWISLAAGVLVIVGGLLQAAEEL
jgi:hypothetical protein